MNLPLHLLRLLPATRNRNGKPANGKGGDHSGGKPLFRPPALPTPNQLNNELPFTVRFGPRLRDRP